MSEAAIPLTWDQVSAWRLAQHGLAPRLGAGGMLEAARRTCGVHTQVMSAAEWSLGARVDGLLPGDVQSALWETRTLVKTWAMRATLHLLATDDLPLFAAARSASISRNYERYFSQSGVPEGRYQEVLDTAAEVLSEGPVTREELATALGERMGLPVLQGVIGGEGWGSPLKPMAWRGDLCFGPTRGRNVTFVNPHSWVDGWEQWDPQEALGEVVRRYLRTYGPATPALFAGWWEAHQVTARAAFRALAGELTQVEIEGWPAVALTETLEPMRSSSHTGTVRLLPLFDAYVVGMGRRDDIAALLPPEQYKRVFRMAGWVSAVVLLDGRIAGTWETRGRGSGTDLTVQMFSRPTGALLECLEHEAQRLGSFLGMPMSVQVSVD